MRRTANRTLAAFSLLLISASASVAAPRSGRSPEAIQAPASDDGLVILTRAGRAEVVSGSSPVQRLRLRRGERLESVAEITGGFVTAGVQDQEENTKLVIFMGDSSGTRRLQVPSRQDALQLRPTLLVDGGDLVGAAWLEGPDLKNLRVRASEWDGAHWGPVVTVSRRSPGSQSGLTGTVLRDGSSLLVWSQFDGHDDDLYFSWQDGGKWSSSDRVSANNLQPDVAPSVTFKRQGAMLAWSRFDGSEYRLWTADFDRGRWLGERQLGRPGSLYPQLIRRGESIFTVSRRAWPRGWSVRRTGKNGRDESETLVLTADSGRPILAHAGRTSVTLVWPSTGRATETTLERVP